MKGLILIILLSPIQGIFSQNNYNIDILHQGEKTSLRGLSVVQDSVIWVSGSNGFVGRSTDSGNTWNFTQIHDYDSAEFRDIEAFDINTAVVMSSVQPACILKTVDGGVTWKKVFISDDPAVFLDGMDFYGNSGICLGDPINNWFYLLHTKNQGDSWKVIRNRKNIADSIAAFAASGSCIQYLDAHNIIFATGGKTAALYRSDHHAKRWKEIKTPIVHGADSKGIFSMDFISVEEGVIAGGDYLHAGENERSLFTTTALSANGEIWKDLSGQSNGYVSCVKKYNGVIITCGTSGINYIDVIDNSVITLSDISFNVIGISPMENAVYFAGINGMIGKLIISAR